jgi:hypothetical protein
MSRRKKTVECCGNEISLDHFTNTCPDCESDYSFDGSRLAPREQWGEETGEHWTEIIYADRKKD